MERKNSGSQTSTTSAVLGGIIAWAVVLSGILAAGLATDVWALADISTRADDLIPSFGVLVLISTVVLIGGPVTLYLRTGLVTPLIGLILYFGYWAVFGVTSGFGGVRGLYVALLYGVYALIGLLIVTALEYVLRAWGLGRTRPNSKESK